MAAEEERQPLVPAAGVPYEVALQNPTLAVRPGEAVAWGWEPWVAEEDEFVPPELGAIDSPLGPVQGIFSEERYDVALWQTVEVAPELALTFRMRFLVQPGHNSERARPRGMVVGVGIDPYGGSDPRAPTVQWALRDLPYDTEVESSVTAQPQARTVTCFVRSLAFLPGSGTAAYGGAVRACWNICVRTRYARTYLLLPPGADQSLWVRAAKKAQAEGWTMGGSADDAGLASVLLWDQQDNDPPRPVVRAINPQGWGSNLASWFATHYAPGVTFIAMTENDLPPL